MIKSRRMKGGSVLNPQHLLAAFVLLLVLLTIVELFIFDASISPCITGEFARVSFQRKQAPAPRFEAQGLLTEVKTFEPERKRQPWRSEIDDGRRWAGAEEPRVLNSSAHAVAVEDDLDEEATARAVLEDWKQCRILFFLHIAKTGGTSIFNMYKNLKYPHFGKKHAFGKKQHATFAENRANKYFEEATEDDLQLVLSIETMHPLLEEMGWSHDADTCFVATVRDPYGWTRSAAKHARAYAKKRFAEYEYFTTTANVETSFFPHIWNARSLTLVDFPRQQKFERIVETYLHDLGYPDANLGHRGSYSKDVSMIDWDKWTETCNPLDRDLYDVVARKPVLHFRFQSETFGQESIRTSVTNRGLFEQFRHVVEQFEWKPPPLSMKGYLAEQGYNTTFGRLSS